MYKKQSVYSVGQISKYIKNMFAQDYFLQTVSVKGEASNVKYHYSGHIYFTLKDQTGAIACIMFAGNAKGLKFKLEEGQQIVVTGNVDVYERDGKYQLYARSIELDGAGQLYAEYEALKAELEELGMFDASFKQPIPKYIKTLGVVTAQTGAAIRDIINVTKRRNPFVQIILYPAIVQGAESAQSVVEGIKALEKRGVDCMIVGRGGGSIEDLWSFNERIVAQAVFDCSVPIISAVGHETDFTIIDFVSDLRAPTPSAAAELATVDIFALMDRMRDYQASLDSSMTNTIRGFRNKVNGYARQLSFLSPQRKLQDARHRLVTTEDRLHELMKKKLADKRSMVALYCAKLEGLSPLKRLSEGYGYITSDNNRKISSVKDVNCDDDIMIYVSDGKIEAKITGLNDMNLGDEING